MTEEKKYWNPVLAFLLAGGFLIIMVEVVLIVLRLFFSIRISSEMVSMFVCLVGPLWFVLLLLGCATLYLLFGLLLSQWRFIRSYDGEKYERYLTYIIEITPLIGLTGSFIALTQAGFTMDMSQEQSKLIESLIRNTSNAFVSTIVGVMITIIAYTLKWKFFSESEKRGNS